AIENTVSQLSERWRLYEMYVMTPCLMVGSLVISMKSDQIGRRFVFMIPMITSTIDCIILAIVIKLNLHYGYNFIGVFIWCSAAGDRAMDLASYALVSDTHGKREEEPNSAHDKKVTKQDNVNNKVKDAEFSDLDPSREPPRTLKLAFVDISRTLFRSAISFATGYIIEYAGFFNTLMIVIACKVALFIFGFLFITETGKQKKSAGFVAPLRLSLVLVNIGIIFTLFSYVDEYGVLRTYQMSPPFCFSAVQLGWFNTVDSCKTLLTIPQILLWKRIGLYEATVATIGMVAAGCSTLLLATVRQTWVFFVAPIITCPGDVTWAMARAITSRLVGRSALASTFAVMYWGEVISWFVATVASSYLYQYSLDTVPTAPFYMATGFFVVSASLFAAEIWNHRRSPKDDTDDDTKYVPPTESTHL
ncbi:hypothetical protein BaRGS_00033779, partial [Batillaria attramentaria]